MAPESSRGQGTDVKKSTLERLFEGWQLGLAVVIVAVVAVVFAVPRPVLPDEVPMPDIDGDAIEALSRQEAALAARVQPGTLSFEVRSTGEAFRRYGIADAQGDAAGGQQALAALRAALQEAVRQGPEGLQQLRAYQMHQFLHELEQFEHTGIESQALMELGGGFVAQARRAGWLVREGSKLRLVARRHEREAMFRRRWAEIMGMTQGPFALTLDEQRAFYAFLMLHPIIKTQPQPGLDDAARCREANAFLLRKVTELGRVDPSYPTGYAVGVLQLRLGRPRDAVPPLAEFVERDEGAWALRARNALREAHERLAPE